MMDMTEPAYPDWDDLTPEEQAEEVATSTEATPSRYREARLIAAFRDFQARLAQMKLEEGI